MRRFRPLPASLWTFASAVALAAILSAGVSPDPGQAVSRSTTMINGKTITVVGGSIQSINATDRKAVVVLDGRRIVIRDGKVTAGKKVYDVGRYDKIEIDARGGELKIYVDGRLLE